MLGDSTHRSTEKNQGAIGSCAVRVQAVHSRPIHVPRRRPHGGGDTCHMDQFFSLRE